MGFLSIKIFFHVLFNVSIESYSTCSIYNISTLFPGITDSAVSALLGSNYLTGVMAYMARIHEAEASVQMQVCTYIRTAYMAYGDGMKAA